MFKRKYILILLALMLAAAMLFTACGKSGGQSDYSASKDDEAEEENDLTIYETWVADNGMVVEFSRGGIGVLVDNGTGIGFNWSGDLSKANIEFSDNEDGLSAMDYSGISADAEVEGDHLNFNFDGQSYEMLPAVGNTDLDTMPWLTFDPYYETEDTLAMSCFMLQNSYIDYDGYLYGSVLDKASDLHFGRFSIIYHDDYMEIGESELLDEEHPLYICTDDDLIYYVTDSGIKSMLPDGSDIKTIYSGKADYMQLKEGRLYFTDGDSCYVSMNTDGTDIETVIGRPVAYPYGFLEDWIIFQDIEDSESLYMMQESTGCQIKLNDETSISPIMSAYDVYYETPREDGEGNQLCKLSVDIAAGGCYTDEGTGIIRSALKADKADNHMGERYALGSNKIFGSNGSDTTLGKWSGLNDDQYAMGDVMKIQMIADTHRVEHQYDDEGVPVYVTVYTMNWERRSETIAYVSRLK